MPIDATLVDAASGHSLHTTPGIIDPKSGPILITGSPANTHGTFKTANRQTAGTTIIAEPILGGSIVLTDLIVTTDKVNGASLTVEFTDGTNTVIISRSILTDAPANFAIGFTGLFLGWEDARVSMITVGNVDATVTVGYYKSSQSLGYDDWNQQR